MTDEPIILVCAPANSPRVSAGAVFTHSCAKCGCRVSLAPTGQRFIADHPETQILCMYCYEPQPDEPIELCASANEIALEIASAVENVRFRRN